MPKKYKCKGERAAWSLENLQKAVCSVLMYGKSQKKAASDFGVPQQTLHRHLENAKNGDGVEKVPGRPRILVRTDEDELVSVIINLEKWLFGPTKIDIRQLAYQY